MTGLQTSALLVAGGVAAGAGLALAVAAWSRRAGLGARLLELVEDDTTHRLTPSKLWFNLGNISMTIGFLKVVWTSTVSEGLSIFFMVYGGLVAGSQLLNRYLGQRAGTGGAAPEGSTKP